MEWQRQVRCEMRMEKKKEKRKKQERTWLTQLTLSCLTHINSKGAFTQSELRNWHYFPYLIWKELHIFLYDCVWCLVNSPGRKFKINWNLNLFFTVKIQKNTWLESDKFVCSYCAWNFLTAKMVIFTTQIYNRKYSPLLQREKLSSSPALLAGDKTINLTLSTPPKSKEKG